MLELVEIQLICFLSPAPPLTSECFQFQNLGSAAHLKRLGVGLPSLASEPLVVLHPLRPVSVQSFTSFWCCATSHRVRLTSLVVFVLWYE